MQTQQPGWIPLRTGLHLRLSYLTLHLLLPPSWSQNSIVWQPSLPPLAHSPFSLTEAPSPLIFSCISLLGLAPASWRVWTNIKWYWEKWLKTSDKMNWLTHHWWKRIPSWVVGGAHGLWYKVVAQLPKILLSVTWECVLTTFSLSIHPPMGTEAASMSWLSY